MKPVKLGQRGGVCVAGRQMALGLKALCRLLSVIVRGRRMISKDEASSGKKGTPKK